MNRQASRDPLQRLVAAIGRLIARWPYVSLSLVAHAALLTLLYYFGSHQLQRREQEAEVASSLRATSLASTAKRLDDLETIRRLMEKSAGRVDSPSDADAAPIAPPQTPEEMVQRARELSQQIDKVDEEIQAEELARLTRALEARQPEASANDEKAAAQKAAEPEVTASHEREAGGNTQAAVTPETAASEVAALEAKARETLIKRQQSLEAKANGVPVEGQKPGSGEQATSANASAPAREGQGSGAAVGAEIADFIGAGGRPEEMGRSERYTSLSFFDGGEVRIPPVDATTMVRGRGRTLGAGGEFANRVYLNSWYIIGPFPGRHGADLFDNPSYPPEKAVLLDAVYFGKDQRLLKWRYVTTQRYPLVPPDPVEDSVYYGYTEVFVDQACDLIAWIGADDDVQIHLNDRLVWEGGNVNKGTYFRAVFNTSNTYLHDYNRTEGQRVLHFNKGRNKIFFKLSNGPNNPYLSLVLTRQSEQGPDG
jgi:hypothetical protein